MFPASKIMHAQNFNPKQDHSARAVKPVEVTRCAHISDNFRKRIRVITVFSCMPFGAKRKIYW